jgi:hypothetical protein
MSSIFYQRRFVFWWSPWIYNDLYAITSYMYISLNFLMKKIVLNTILTNQSQTYLFPTFIIRKILKFYNWFTINSIEDSIVSKWNLSKIWIYFLVFSWKTTSFFNFIFFWQLFMYTLSCFHPYPIATHSQNFPFFFPTHFSFFYHVITHTHSFSPITSGWWVITAQS